MAGFQKSVSRDTARAVPGMLAGLNTAAMFLPTPVACDDGCHCGRGAWLDADGKVSNAAQGIPNEYPIGFILRVKTGDIPVTDEATTFIAPNASVAVVLHGDIYLSSDQAVTRGDSVFVSTTDGTVICAPNGSAQPGYEQTNFEAREDAAPGEVFIASNW